MRKGVVTSIAVSLVAILGVIAVIFIQSLDAKTSDRAGLEELQDHMMKFICEDGYSDILVDYHENNLQRQCNDFVSKYDDLILTMNVEDERIFLANYYDDIVRRYSDLYNANILINTVKFDSKVSGDHIVFSGGKFTEQEKVFRLSRLARQYVYDHYDKYMKSNQE